MKFFRGVLYIVGVAMVGVLINTAIGVPLEKLLPHVGYSDMAFINAYEWLKKWWLSPWIGGSLIGTAIGVGLERMWQRRAIPPETTVRKERTPRVELPILPREASSLTRKLQHYQGQQWRTITNKEQPGVEALYRKLGKYGIKTPTVEGNGLRLENPRTHIGFTQQIYPFLRDGDVDATSEKAAAFVSGLSSDGT